MKPMAKGGSIPAAGVSGQQLQHNGGVFSTTLEELHVQGGWLGGRVGERVGGSEEGREGRREERRKEGKEGGREDNLGLGWLLLGFLL